MVASPHQVRVGMLKLSSNFTDLAYLKHRVKAPPTKTHSVLSAWLLSNHDFEESFRELLPQTLKILYNIISLAILSSSRGLRG